MVNERYANAMTEVLYYLKGIEQNDLDKIPDKVLKFLNENSSSEYICDFDYTKPLNELDLMKETKGIIGIICYNYWCETEGQKVLFLSQLKDNDKNNEEYLKSKYDINNIFSKTSLEQESFIEEKMLPSEQVKKEKWYKRLINFFRKH